MKDTEMTREEILTKLTQVFQDVFDDDTIQLTENTTASDIPDWDSLMHIDLCITMEKCFKTKINPVKVASLIDIGSLIDLLSDAAGIN